MTSRGFVSASYFCSSFLFSLRKSGQFKTFFSCMSIFERLSLIKYWVRGRAGLWPLACRKLFFSPPPPPPRLKGLRLQSMLAYRIFRPWPGEHTSKKHQNWFLQRLGSTEFGGDYFLLLVVLLLAKMQDYCHDGHIGSWIKTKNKSMFY